MKRLATSSRVSIFVISAISLATCAYLVVHFYNSMYPQSLETDSICNISGFFNCNTATFSPFSSFWGIPTAALGLTVSLIFLIGAFITSPKVQSTNYSLASLNAAGCLFLLCYSLVVLKGLCPACTLYYFCSIGIFFVYYSALRRSVTITPKVAVLYAILLAVVSGGFILYTDNEEVKQQDFFTQIYTHFEQVPPLKETNISSPLRLLPEGKTFAESTIRLQLFTDFECSFCKIFATTILPVLKKQYQDFLAIEYFLYPLDSSCNHHLSMPMHPNACRAAAYALCNKDHFETIHDQLYQHFDALGTYLDEQTTNPAITACMASKETQDAIEAMIQCADKASVIGTPTLFINGRKFGAGLPLKYYILIFDRIIAESNTKTD